MRTSNGVSVTLNVNWGVNRAKTFTIRTDADLENQEIELGDTLKFTVVGITRTITEQLD